MNLHRKLYTRGAKGNELLLYLSIINFWALFSCKDAIVSISKSGSSKKIVRGTDVIRGC
jgi:hypothetical protein